MTPATKWVEGYDYDCRRCGGRHVIACCHASRHTMCDRCVADQHRRRFEEGLLGRPVSEEPAP